MSATRTAETQPGNGPKDSNNASIQVICLGSGGGPSEDNVTGFLVRSTASGWVKGSILAVDAGSHLAAITRILEQELPLVSRGEQRADSDGNIFHGSPMSRRSNLTASPSSSPPAQPIPTPDPVVLKAGPFAGVPLPHASARANAAHIVRNHVATYLITHPHLDHLSGFAINTAAFHATSRPKRLAALPFTVDAIKRHIFNDVIWPNMSDEDGGVGFVTFQRLKEGGDIMVGEGEGRGYIEVCEGLAAKGFKISHGKCVKGGAPVASHRGSLTSLSDLPDGYNTNTPRQHDSRHSSAFLRHFPETPGHHSGHHSPSTLHQPPTSFPFTDTSSVVDSTAYFIRDTTGREVLIFGDVEPDSISVAPRLARVWAEAAAKIAIGSLRGIFIECSYDDSQADAVLFGHLAPRHLIAELQVLADMVREERTIRARDKALRKRKRASNGTSISRQASDDLLDKKRSRSIVGQPFSQNSRRSSIPEQALTDQNVDSPLPLSSVQAMDVDVTGGTSKSGTDGLNDNALKGVRVIVIHVKDTLKDGPHVGERILAQLEDQEAVLAARGDALGCEFVISESGQDYWF